MRSKRLVNVHLVCQVHILGRAGLWGGSSIIRPKLGGMLTSSVRELIWRPYLPEPRPAFKVNEGDPEPVPLEVLRDLRDLCANFRVPPRQFRRRVRRGIAGWYRAESDIVAVDPDCADEEGLSGDDGYYGLLVHELLHATGHPSRLGRATTEHYSGEMADLEEGTVRAATRIVLAQVGFPPEAVDWNTRTYSGLPKDQEAAELAAAWVLN
jgi:Zincin-like metallopeptidase